MVKNKINTQPYIKQFYRGNIGYLLLAVMQTIFMTAANLLVSWLIQQIIDMIGGIDIGFSFLEIIGLTILDIILIFIACGFAYFSKPRFISKAILQYKNYVFSQLSKKGISTFYGENTATYISALSNDVSSIETGYLANIFIIFDQSVMFAGALVLMFYYSPLLTFVSIGISILPIAASILTGGLVENAEKMVSYKNESYVALSDSSVSAGSVLIFVQLLNFVINPISTIPQALAECKASKALIVKLAESLTSNVREEGKIEKLKLQNKITVKNLTFAYEEEKNVLNNVNFTFEAGKRYCLVGASGSGKSTLMNLLMASHHNYSGSIYFDEAELKSIRSEALYDMISVIQQNVFIFNASIRDNITMFSDFSHEAVDRAIKISGLSQLIAERGEEYLCGENGCGLSGGEKQRISIARSLLKKSRVMLVDEATSALDPQTATQVTNAILGLDGMTRIVITHALDEALLKQYDCILTLKNGSITEFGSFDELMRNKGYFYSLFTVSQ